MIPKWFTATSSLSFLFFLLSCIHNPPPFDEAKWSKDVEGQKADRLYEPHFKDGKYFNPWMPMEQGGFMRLLKWKLSSRGTYTQEETTFKPGFIPNLKERIRSMPEGDFIAWIGHATFLIRLKGEYFLTDPMFSERALLPKRIVPPALTAEEINEIAPNVNILISHNHYDHLDTKSIEALSGTARFFVPMGLKGYIEGMDKRHVQGMDWWQSIDIGKGIKIICLPAQHWSRRLFQWTNTTLWASYLIVTPEATIYFGGDSGYFIGYKEFGKLYPDITYALMPTTAINPRWFMHYAHMDIQEALKAFQDLGARYFIPTQWGTFPLGDEPPGYPVLQLKKKIEGLGVDPSRFIIMDIGQIEPVKKR